METGAYEIVPTDSVERFIRLLKRSPGGPVFNPWWQVDKENDVDHNAPVIRRRHLRAYLRKRLRKTEFVVIGEALGYRGGHFSGIPMTSERILLGKKKDNGIQPDDVFSSIKPTRTSRREQCLDGFSEPTATIVWSSLVGLGLKPEQFVLWNAYEKGRIRRVVGAQGFPRSVSMRRNRRTWQSR